MYHLGQQKLVLLHLGLHHKTLRRRRLFRRISFLRAETGPGEGYLSLFHHVSCCAMSADVLSSKNASKKEC